MNAEQPSSEIRCTHCQAVGQPGDTFCRSCGSELPTATDQNFDDVFEPLRPVLAYYFSLLALLLLYKFTDAFSSDLVGYYGITAATTVLTLLFCIVSWKTVRPLYSFRGFQWSVLWVTVIGAVVGSFVVNQLANFINTSLHDDVFYDTYLFSETAYPLLFSTLFIAVEPALFEEVAFRGFMFTHLSRIAKGSTAVYVSACLFGILHLSAISLIWLIPIGIAFAELRRRYQTLWYGMAGHFTYNFCLVLYEVFGV